MTELQLKIVGHNCTVEVHHRFLTEFEYVKLEPKIYKIIRELELYVPENDDCVYQYNDVNLEINSRTAWIKQYQVKLTERESEVFFFLIQRQGKPATHDLLNKSLGLEGLSRCPEQLVSRINKKFYEQGCKLKVIKNKRNRGRYI